MLDEGGLDAVVINTSGCGVTVKDYGYMLRQDRAYAATGRAHRRARQGFVRVRGRACVLPTAARDRTARRLSRRLLAAARPEDHRAAEARFSPPPASPCSTCPRGISAAARPAPTTCSSRSSRRRLRARKVAHIESTAPDLVAAGNIGCMTQIAAGNDAPGGAHGRVARLGDRRAGAVRARLGAQPREPRQQQRDGERGRARPRSAPASPRFPPTACPPPAPSST